MTVAIAFLQQLTRIKKKYSYWSKLGLMKAHDLNFIHFLILGGTNLCVLDNNSFKKLQSCSTLKHSGLLELYETLLSCLDYLKAIK